MTSSAGSVPPAAAGIAGKETVGLAQGSGMVAGARDRRSAAVSPVARHKGRGEAIPRWMDADSWRQSWVLEGKTHCRLCDTIWMLG